MDAYGSKNIYLYDRGSFDWIRVLGSAAPSKAKQRDRVGLGWVGLGLIPTTTTQYHLQWIYLSSFCINRSWLKIEIMNKKSLNLPLFMLKSITSSSILSKDYHWRRLEPQQSPSDLVSSRLAALNFIKTELFRSLNTSLSEWNSCFGGFFLKSFWSRQKNCFLLAPGGPPGRDSVFSCISYLIDSSRQSLTWSEIKAHLFAQTFDAHKISWKLVQSSKRTFQVGFELILGRIWPQGTEKESRSRFKCRIWHCKSSGFAPNECSDLLESFIRGFPSALRLAPLSDRISSLRSFARKTQWCFSRMMLTRTWTLQPRNSRLF